MIDSIDLVIQTAVVDIDISVDPSIYAVENPLLIQRVSDIEDELASLPSTALTAGPGLEIVGTEIRYDISSLTRI